MKKSKAQIVVERLLDETTDAGVVVWMDAKGLHVKNSHGPQAKQEALAMVHLEHNLKGAHYTVVSGDVATGEVLKSSPEYVNALRERYGSPADHSLIQAAEDCAENGKTCEFDHGN